MHYTFSLLFSPPPAPLLRPFDLFSTYPSSVQKSTHSGRWVWVSTHSENPPGRYLLGIPTPGTYPFFGYFGLGTTVGTQPWLEWWDVARIWSLFGGGPEVSLQMYLGGFYLIYSNADGHFIGTWYLLMFVLVLELAYGSIVLLGHFTLERAVESHRNCLPIAHLGRMSLLRWKRCRITWAEIVARCCAVLPVAS